MQANCMEILGPLPQAWLYQLSLYRGAVDVRNLRREWKNLSKKRCKTMTRLQWKSSPCWFNQNVAFAYLSVLFWKGESYLAGLHAERPIASWYARQTRKSASSGPRKTFMTSLQTLCGLMKPQYNSKHTGGSAVGRRARVRSPVINHAQSTASNSTSGVESATEVQQDFVSLMGSWMRNCMWKSWKSASFHF